jgi:hypothetical protein
MPSLTAVAFETNLPFIWRCTECDVIFDFGRILRASLTRAQTEQLNREFQEHCEENHPHSAVMGLPTKGTL